MHLLNLAFIKSRRLELKLTLEEMANHFGFKSSSTYLKYEKGMYAFKAEQLPILAEVLDCSIEKFFMLNVAKTETLISLCSN
ncbi:helix-turn-helix transcriptional regulator [Virgibacillus sp. 179-BFC.A HS]|uniref:Helix-turn-helix transcriptional regulator n=1 Tax=Tigheibacillus jepli TaxID=3035914 RepID=A0ABU5CLJ9_9BACI|nr:helix-turn-helix transcriptional regulator [Virgibacillus sp. 179-BFC.A HS]MDY0407233.1 helix-turn-helix transcriptional regulator [Virgibacillus sp. 179-BFC.A HS]